MTGKQTPKPLPSTAVVAKPYVPAKWRAGSQSLLTQWRKLELTKGLPPATIVYGSAAGVLFAFALVFLLVGHWTHGILTLLPALCFLGYALYFMKYGR